MLSGDLGPKYHGDVQVLRNILKLIWDHFDMNGCKLNYNESDRIVSGTVYDDLTESVYTGQVKFGDQSCLKDDSDKQNAGGPVLTFCYFVKYVILRQNGGIS